MRKKLVILQQLKLPGYKNREASKFLDKQWISSSYFQPRLRVDRADIEETRGNLRWSYEKLMKSEKLNNKERVL